MADRIVLTDVRVFDGRTPSLSAPVTVEIDGNTVANIGEHQPGAPSDDRVINGGDRVFDGGGRVLMPGLIDAHWHAMMAALPMLVMLTADPAYLHLAAAREAERTLMRGFTTVRDAGGPTFALKRAIDEGLFPGPRIYPSGAFISQTSGHGDFRMLNELPRDGAAPLSAIERMGAAVIADGVGEVMRGVREQLMRGASQIKVMAGGGVSSHFDPIDVTQYTYAEMAAAVECAADWGTYVLVHAYTPAAVQQAIKAGVKCIDHGHLLDEPTVAMMAEQGIWWSMQPFLDDEDAIPVPATSRDKQLRVTDGTENAYRLARKHGVRLAWGTDTLFDPALAHKQGKQLAKMSRWFTPAEALTMATAGNAELCALSGERNPYPGKLGVVEPGALADLLVVDGEPLSDLSVLADPRNLKAIIKDGVIHKNELTPAGLG